MSEKYTINNAKNDIQNLQDQNSYDFQEINRLESLIQDYDKRVLQAINFNNLINKKIQDDYENIKKIIIDENVSVTLSNKIDDKYNSNKSKIEELQANISEQMDTKVNSLDLFINVKDFGVVGDGITDDTTALINVFNHVKAQKKKIPIYIPPSFTCLLSSELPMFDGMFIYSTINNSEFGNKAVIINNTTDMFKLTSDVSDITLQGLEFRGNMVDRHTYLVREPNFASGKIIKYSKITNCGFSYFKKTILGRILGCNISNNFFNNGGTCLHISGSDSIIQNNFMDNAEYLNKTEFLVMFESLSLTKFENNYLTGSVREGNGAMLMQIKYGEGLVISRNWLDFSEGCAIYFDTTGNHIIRDNFIRGNCRNPFSQYDAVFTLFDSRSIIFNGNQFIDQVNGNKTFSFRKSNSITKNITVRDNVYKDGYNLLIYKPVNESEDIFIDEPSTTYNKGKFWNGETWNNPIHLKSFPNLSLSFGSYGTVEARTSKTFDITLPSDIPLSSIKSIDFYSPLENGIICDCRRSDTNKLSIRFTNTTNSAITLEDKNFVLTVLY